MNCETARMALSALLDGEMPTAPIAEVERHLDGCADCRSWQESAHDLTRRTRLAQAQPRARPSADARELIHAAADRRSRAREVGVLRVLLVAAALAQLAVTIPLLIFGRYDIARDLGAMDKAESFLQNLVPTGIDEMMGMRFKPSDSSYWALGFRAYTPGWRKPLRGSAAIGPNTGIPGPIIRAQVGDTVLVHFRNNDTHYRWPHSMHPHGFKYTPASDGGYVFAQHFGGRAVKPGESYTYTWTAEPSSVGTWPYHDHSIAQGITRAGPVMELNAELGMFGLIAITDKHTPKVDTEIFLFFHDLYQDDVPSLSQDFDCFNGRSYLGSTPTFTAKVGQRVRWRVAALGKEFHVFHLHGHRWKDEAGRFVDSQVMGPSTTLTVEYTEDNRGDWLYNAMWSTTWPAVWSAGTRSREPRARSGT